MQYRSYPFIRYWILGPVLFTKRAPLWPVTKWNTSLGSEAEVGGYSHPILATGTGKPGVMSNF